MDVHIFPREVKAYDIADSLIDVILKDGKGNEVAIRFLKDIALDLRDQLTRKLKNEPFCEGKKNAALLDVRHGEGHGAPDPRV